MSLSTLIILVCLEWDGANSYASVALKKVYMQAEGRLSVESATRARASANAVNRISYSRPCLHGIVGKASVVAEWRIVNTEDNFSPSEDV